MCFTVLVLGFAVGSRLGSVETDGDGEQHTDILRCRPWCARFVSVLWDAFCLVYMGVCLFRAAP